MSSVKNILEPEMYVFHDKYSYTYEKNSEGVITYYKSEDISRKAFEYYNKYSYIVDIISKYVGIVIDPELFEKIGMSKDVFAVGVPVIDMTGKNIGLVIRNKSGNFLTTLATIEFQIVFA